MKKIIMLLMVVFSILAEYSIAQTTQTQTKVKRKKGWSNKAKGAAIGGGAGAVAGGLIGGNAKGAIIGGAVGAGGGYLVGRSKDKKNGRPNRGVVKTKTKTVTKPD
jgi:osmotically inducible lipoprotein OsmB